MLDFILNIFTDPIAAAVDLIYWIFRGGKSPENSKLFPKTDFSDRLTEEEKLRTDMKQRKNCLDKRM